MIIANENKEILLAILKEEIKNTFTKIDKLSSYHLEDKKNLHMEIGKVKGLAWVSKIIKELEVEVYEVI